MFDVDASEFLVIIVVAILVIGPKDMPAALRAIGRFIGKMRKVSGHFRSGLETMIREAEMEEMEKKWAEQNRKVMEEHPGTEMTAANGGGAALVPPPEPEVLKREPEPDAASAEARAKPKAKPPKPKTKAKSPAKPKSKGAPV